MVRYMSWLLAFWLTLLYVVSRSAPVPRGLGWLTLLAGLFAFLGGAVAPMVTSGWRIGGPVALSFGLFVLFGIELRMRVESWLPWCTFLGLVTYLPIVVAARLWSPKWTRGPHRDFLTPATG